MFLVHLKVDQVVVGMSFSSSKLALPLEEDKVRRRIQKRIRKLKNLAYWSVHIFWQLVFHNHISVANIFLFFQGLPLCLSCFALFLPQEGLSWQY